MQCGRSLGREASPRSLCKDVSFEAHSPGRSLRPPGTGAGRHMAAAAGGERSCWEPAGAGCPLPVSGTRGCVLWLSTQPGRDLTSPELMNRLAQVACALPGWHGHRPSPGLTCLEVEVRCPKVTYAQFLSLRRISLSVQFQTSYVRGSPCPPASRLAGQLVIRTSLYFVFSSNYFAV